MRVGFEQTRGEILERERHQPRQIRRIDAGAGLGLLRYAPDLAWSFFAECGGQEIFV